jgi:hypothetical protein
MAVSTNGLADGGETPNAASSFSARVTLHEIAERKDTDGHKQKLEHERRIDRPIQLANDSQRRNR